MAIVFRLAQPLSLRLMLFWWCTIFNANSWLSLSDVVVGYLRTFSLTVYFWRYNYATISRNSAKFSSWNLNLKQFLRFISLPIFLFRTRHRLVLKCSINQLDRENNNDGTIAFMYLMSYFWISCVGSLLICISRYKSAVSVIKLSLRLTDHRYITTMRAFLTTWQYIKANYDWLRREDVTFRYRMCC